MTNSTPKTKIVRQGSPNSQGKKFSGQRNSSNYMKTVTYFASGVGGVVNNSANATPNNNGTGGRNSKPSNGRQSISPTVLSSAKNIPRSSPMRHESPRGSPTNNFYAGAKFSEPPSAASLPQPPSHWTGLLTGCQSLVERPYTVSQFYEMIANVKA